MPRSSNFGFDVHAMIWSENAPALETELHQRFVRAQPAEELAVQAEES